ncbi:MAG TPA: vWA domain-containing protein, partial [Minicystis sp.]|nr:vWA domain-containing protein [Minicystis sp.]
MNHRTSNERRGARAGGRASLLTRALALLLVAAAPFVPPLHRSGHGRAVAFVVDRSASVGGAARAAMGRFVLDAYRARGDAEVSVVAFDGAAELWSAPGGDLEERATDPGALGFGLAKARGTDVASGVRLAAAALPDGGERRIVLLTDGRATRGDAAAEVRVAEERGIVVDVVPVGGDVPEEPLTQVTA